MELAEIQQLIDEGKYEERKADAEGRPDESDPDDETGDDTEKEA